MLDYLVRSPYGISPQHPRGTTWYARTRRARQGSARREGAASGDPRVRFDRGLFDRFLRASAVMVMDEREPILRGAKAPAHAQSQSYDAATLGGPAEGRASRDAAIEPVRIPVAAGSASAWRCSR